MSENLLSQIPFPNPPITAYLSYILIPMSLVAYFTFRVSTVLTSR